MAFSELTKQTVAGVLLGERLIHARDAYLRLVGREELDEAVECWRPYFETVGAAKGWSILETAIDFLEVIEEADPHGAGPLQVVVLAVAVELIQRKA